MPSFTLMENAGNGLFHQIAPLLSEKDRILVMAGKGNNGGDGIVLSGYLKNHGFHVDLVFPLGKPKTEAAKQHLSYYEALDAGALSKRVYKKRTKPVIITPHPGKFSRLTGLTTAEIQENRIKLAAEYAINNRIIVVLKGHFTVIAFPDGTGIVNPTGNAGKVLSLSSAKLDLKNY